MAYTTMGQCTLINELPENFEHKEAYFHFVDMEIVKGKDKRIKSFQLRYAKVGTALTVTAILIGMEEKGVKVEDGDEIPVMEELKANDDWAILGCGPYERPGKFYKNPPSP